MHAGRNFTMLAILIDKCSGPGCASEEEIETVGGLVFSKINRIPKSNEEFNIDDIINIKILRANERKILTVHITKIVNWFS